jgi:hypothetical protein
MQLHIFLTSELDSLFAQEERILVRNCTEGWVGPRAGLDAAAEKNCPTNTRTPIL